MRHQRVRAFTGRWLAAAVLLPAIAGWANAEISTLGAGDPFSASSYSVNVGYPLAFAFSTDNKSYSLANVELEMAVKLIDGDNKLGVSIMAADGVVDGTPGTVLKSFSFDGRLGEPDVLKGMPVAGGIGGTLAPNQTYWLVASVPDNADPYTDVGWHLSTRPILTQRALLLDGSWMIWEELMTPAAFRLTEAVPVPGAVLLGVLGLGYSGWRLRRRSA